MGELVGKGENLRSFSVGSVDKDEGSQWIDKGEAPELVHSEQTMGVIRHLAIADDENTSFLDRFDKSVDDLSEIRGLGLRGVVIEGFADGFGCFANPA